MSSSLHFELVSPERLVLARDAAPVTVPGGEKRAVAKARKMENEAA